MKALVISDIHANWPALEAVDAAERDADIVLCLGDLVDYGPFPHEVIAWVRAHATHAIRGNHDHAVALREDCRCSPSFRDASETTRELMWQMLTPEESAYLASLPLRAETHIDGMRVAMVHAAPRDPLFRYVSASAGREGWVEEAQGVDADILLTGHTHLPIAIQTNGLLVVNPGSVGQPKDGDPRAAYAVIEDGRVEHRRVAYDVERTVAALEHMTLPREVIAQLVRVLRTGTV
jgi:putative phosphoesterase